VVIRLAWIAGLPPFYTAALALFSVSFFATVTARKIGEYPEGLGFRLVGITRPRPMMMVEN
jgi:hypothetical protein